MGPFKQDECTDSRRVTQEIDNCDKLAKVTGLTNGQIEAMNPIMKCGRKFEWGSLMCTASLGLATKTAQQLIVQNLKDMAPELAKKFEAYNANPNEQNENSMNQELVGALQQPNVNSKLKELYKTDEKIRKILDSQHPLPRQNYCEEIKKTKMELVELETFK